MTDPSYFVVIPAAGKGARFSPSGDVVKQHADLLGKSILQRAIEPFISHQKIKCVVVVLSPYDSGLQQVESDIEHQKLSFQRVGGKTRAESVLNGITTLGTLAGPEDWILVHDAARPLITQELIDRLINELTIDSDGGLLACRLVDTIKNSNERNRVVSTADRKQLWAAQTPQMFRRAKLEQALRMTIDRNDITDESSAIEALGINPLLVESDTTNFKITYAHDLDRAKLVLTNGAKKKGSGNMRIGEGFDLHALVPDRPLVIGGVNIPHDKGLLGHSDADVLIHALIDALLGACGLGDIGQHFPDTDPKWHDVDSKLLLNKVYAMICRAGYEVVNIDSTIIAEQPKLSPHIPEMRRILAALVGAEVNQINIKAKTSERLGAVGREECVVATVTVLLSTAT